MRGAASEGGAKGWSLAVAPPASFCTGRIISEMKLGADGALLHLQSSLRLDAGKIVLLKAYRCTAVIMKLAAQKALARRRRSFCSMIGPVEGGNPR